MEPTRRGVSLLMRSGCLPWGNTYLTIQNTLFYAVAAANATPSFSFFLRAGVFSSGFKDFPGPL